MKKLPFVPLFALVMALWALAAGQAAQLDGAAGEAALREQLAIKQAEGASVTVENGFLTPEQRAALRGDFPHITLTFTDTLYGVKVEEGARQADFKGVEEARPADIERLLRAHPTLEKIALFEARLTTEQQLALFEAYRAVDFGFTVRIAEHTVRTDATAFSTLHSKRSKQHTSQQLSALRMCRHLKALDIGHNAVTDISFLYDLPEIRILIIALNRIEDITPLASLKYLEYLEMFSNRISDISPLAGLRHLKDLNIGFNRIEDLTPLYGLSQLERLWMYSFRRRGHDDTTPEIREKLKKRLVMCEFEFEHYPTLEGWREHPRYFVMADIFKTGVFRPWEGKGEACEDCTT